MEKVINIGLDAGSTTVKMVALNQRLEMVYKEYGRHYADIKGSTARFCRNLMAATGYEIAHLKITGSAGMGLAERYDLPFVQEVVASSKVVQSRFREVQTLVDMGGEDAKMIFFRKENLPDMRMNGNCAGGTGAFIDHMASLLGVEVERLDRLARKSRMVHPVASRCGVFAKTDVQNLLSRNVAKEDITASIFHAVSMQCIASLSRGCELRPPVMLCGGPLARIPALRKAFCNLAKLDSKDILLPEDAEMITAWGAALAAAALSGSVSINHFLEQLESPDHKGRQYRSSKMRPLFSSKKEQKKWETSSQTFRLPQKDLKSVRTDHCFLGIDSGSTTTKIILVNDEGHILFRYYKKNEGNSLDAVHRGLQYLLRKTRLANKECILRGSCVTGYGEDLVRNAFGLDFGLVETMAHYMAALQIHPETSFILDIGGQDMKAIFIRNRTISRLEINEACSSGCGSFIETFANTLKHPVEDFARMACDSKTPCNLGTRCTVFMNSKVRQSLREGASVSDISAGLGYSVVKNCLHKVLKLKQISELGEHIMIQGGASRNTAIIRAFELETGKQVMSTSHPEMMGAYGAALYARARAKKRPLQKKRLEEWVQVPAFSEKLMICRGCENRCSINRIQFQNGHRYFAGNKCEKIFTNCGERKSRGINVSAEKYELLFNRGGPASQPGLTVGIPRVLGQYENYPFWHALLTGCGVHVRLSDTSTPKLCEKGVHTVMSDNICFPAKLVHGHIMNLMEKNVNRIFMPFVVYEKMEEPNCVNSYNCPVVTGYSEVIKSSIDPQKSCGVPLDTPCFSLKDLKLFQRACENYLLEIVPQMNSRECSRVFGQALQARSRFEEWLKKRCETVVHEACEKDRPVILLASRPYHCDPLIQHKTADLMAAMGVDVITEDVVRNTTSGMSELHHIGQWTYTNRILNAARYAARAPEQVHYVQLTSFGCGPDAFILDEVSDILQRHGKNATVLKVDDVHNTGSMRLRVRSLVESLMLRQRKEEKKKAVRFCSVPSFEKKDRNRTILVPWFSDFYSPFLPAAFHLAGYHVKNLPPSDQESEEYGLKYSNNEICYPGILVVGDMIKALYSGEYERDKIAFGITQTGGQCRATNYLSLLKKALLSAGVSDVPVVSTSLSSKPVNHQPGFSISWRKVYWPVITCLAYSDSLAQMYYATAPRELVPGSALRLKNYYIEQGIEALKRRDIEKFFFLTRSAARDFNSIQNPGQIPRVGIVGEIFLKYNNYGQRNVLNWLIQQGIEPYVPALSDFFTVVFVNRRVSLNSHINGRKFTDPLMPIAEKYIYRIIRGIESEASMFRGYQPVGNLWEDARKASQIIDLNAQFGEGWRIASEFAHFAKRGINQAISLQPFGCIANHIISKGIEKRVKYLYPSMNILFLDFDSGTSEANLYNRLHFIVENARNEISATENPQISTLAE